MEDSPTEQCEHRGGANRPTARAVRTDHRVPTQPNVGPPAHSPALPARLVIENTVARTEESVIEVLSHVR